MKPFACCVFFLALSSASAEELPVSTSAPAAIAPEPGGTGDFSAPGSTETLKPQPAVISGRMMEKMRELEKTAAEEKGQDDAALERLGAKIGAKITLMPLDEELMAVIRETGFDWRVRYLLILHKSYGIGKKLEKYADDFIEVMKDKKQHERIRGVSVLILSDISKKNDRVKEALAEVAKSSDTPGEVLNSVMAVVGLSGMDDADALMKLTEHGPADFNEIGINLNAVRALGKSKDPRAFGYLVKIFDESVPDSFFNTTALETFWSFIRNPETSERVKPVIVPRLLKLLDDRTRIGESRRDAAALLAELQVQEAIEPMLKWFLPGNRTDAKEGGGIIWMFWRLRKLSQSWATNAPYPFWKDFLKISAMIQDGHGKRKKWKR